MLGALLLVDDYPPPSPKVDQALAFIRNQTDKNGALGMSDVTIPDYPNYSTALAVNAVVAAHRQGWEAVVAPMIAYLRTIH